MRWVMIILVVVAIVLTVGLPWFLGPDDMTSCSTSPTTGNCVSADAIIAISGGDTSARADEAIRLYKAGWAPRIIFSGAAADKSGPSNAEAMRKQALNSGIPSAAIMLEEFSATTAENAQNTSELVQSMGLTRIILVTSAYHQRRASIEFHKRLGTAVQIINHPVSNDKQWSNWWWMTPYGWVLGIGEIIKIIASETNSL